MFVNRTPEYFMMIAREKSISRAAEKLYISQSSLSQYIAKLESELEVKLLDRSKNPIQLTEAGRVYQSYLESNTYLYQKLQADLNELNDNRSRLVTVGLGTWRGSLLLPDILPEFMVRHPKARLSLHEFPVSELSTLVQNEAVDFAVMNTVEASLQENLVLEVIDYERILLVMNRDDPAARKFSDCQRRGEPLDLHQLQGRRFISLGRTLSVGRQVGNFLDRSRISFPERIETTNNNTVLNLAAKGLGFCFLVETGLQDMLRRPELIAFDLHAQDLMIPLSLVYKKNSYLSPLALDAIDLIQSYYQTLIQNSRAQPNLGEA